MKSWIIKGCRIVIPHLARRTPCCLYNTQKVPLIAMQCNVMQKNARLSKPSLAIWYHFNHFAITLQPGSKVSKSKQTMGATTLTQSFSAGPAGTPISSNVFGPLPGGFAAGAAGLGAPSFAGGLGPLPLGVGLLWSGGGCDPGLDALPCVGLLKFGMLLFDWRFWYCGSA